MLGGSTYKGELSEHTFNTDFVHPAFGAFYRHNWDRRWSWKIELNYGKISGDDAYGSTAYQRDRNLSFESTILELSPQVEFNFYLMKQVGQTILLHPISLPESAFLHLIQKHI